MNVALPKQVQAQLEAAQAIEDRLSGQAPPEGQTAAPQPEPESAPEPQAATPTAPEPQAAAPAPQPDVWEQRYRTLQRKFDAEVPLLHQQLKESDTQLRQALSRLVEPERAPKPGPRELITQQDIDNFGADMVDMTKRAALAVVQEYGAQLSAELRREFGAMREQFGQVTERVARSQNDLFWDAVRKAVPDWPQVDADPRWIEWLDTRARGAKQTYRELAAAAVAEFDLEPVVELVQLWKQTVAPPPAAPAPPKSQELSRQVAPSSARASAPAKQERGWTEAEYREAFDQRNRYKMTQNEWEALMAEADRALAEGRVR